jgi:hypothetical protein
MRESSTSIQRPGNLRGSTIVGGLEHFERRYGPAAAQSVVAAISPEWRRLVVPNTPLFGLLPSRLYPYAFVGELIRTMARVVKATDEDAFVRELAAAGVDATLGTIHRLVLRWVATPRDYAKRAQEVWDQYHDAGRVTVLSITDREYLVQMSELPAHDVTVCKVVLEGRRRILMKTGVNIVDARREKCITWGHEVCVMRYRW